MGASTDNANQSINRIMNMDGIKLNSKVLRQICSVGIAAAVVMAFGMQAAVANTASKAEIAEADTTEVYTVVDEMPEMIGGNSSLYGKIRYPRAAVRAGVEGRVFIQFVVDKDGNVRDPKVLRDIGGGCGEAAIEAIKEVKFTPGRLNGEAVNVQYSMPVTFRLENV